MPPSLPSLLFPYLSLSSELLPSAGFIAAANRFCINSGTQRTESPFLRDAGADMLTVGAVMAVLDFREEVGNHHFLDQSQTHQIYAMDAVVIAGREDSWDDEKSCRHNIFVDAGHQVIHEVGMGENIMGSIGLAENAEFVI
ncbi:hypothetical protein TRIUR3_12899 [Triticum urartu]|uniref:Uncharacterized protein n=1 Tax=Triticum urartu TaxID=4572 RepID=M7ZBW8_TRIUA|nr:hypothetical protein TRIUR3_12899 [Triticum urartu]